MRIANAHGPTPDQTQAAFARDDGQPIYMVNLLPTFMSIEMPASRVRS